MSMIQAISEWRPSWWSDAVHGSAWERSREALRRDWSQTKHDLGLGGHEMNQSIDDTINQATGKAHLPNINQANPARVIGDWPEAETAYRYGHAARLHFGATHPSWTADLEAALKLEWMTGHDRATQDWDSALRFVRRGYEFEGGHVAPKSPR